MGKENEHTGVLLDCSSAKLTKPLYTEHAPQARGTQRCRVLHSDLLTRLTTRSHLWLARVAGVTTNLRLHRELQNSIMISYQCTLKWELRKTNLWNYNCLLVPGLERKVKSSKITAHSKNTEALNELDHMKKSSLMQHSKKWHSLKVI